MRRLAKRHVAAQKIQKFVRRSRSKRSGALANNRNSQVAMSQGGSVSLSLTRGRIGTVRPLRYGKSLSVSSWMPERFENTMVTTMEWSNANASLTAAAGNYWSVCVNSIVNAFNNTYTPTLTPGGSGLAYAQNGTLVQGYAVSNSPLGYTQLAAIYTYYKVFRYRLEVTVTPQSPSDSVRVIAIPLGTEETPSATAGNMNVRVLEGQPNTRSKTVLSGCSSLDNTIIIEGCPYKDLGLTREQYNSGGQVGTASNYFVAFPTGADFVGIFSQILTGSNSAGIVTYQVKLIQDIVWDTIDAPLN